MVEFWDERYSGNEYHYGEKPNEFVKEYLDEIKEKNLNILFAADGEGRNSVYAAMSGHNVYSFDQSSEGKHKAERLAEKNNVKINYQVCDVFNYKPEIKFDLIIMTYFHLPSSIRAKAHKHLTYFLADKGRIVLEAFNKKQINFNSGGPKNIDMLYSIEELKSDFHHLKIAYIEELEKHLEVSESHFGKAQIIRLIAEKE